MMLSCDIDRLVSTNNNQHPSVHAGRLSSQDSARVCLKTSTVHQPIRFNVDTSLDTSLKCELEEIGRYLCR
jgi:hypothetical protein